MHDPWQGREKARLRNERSIERAVEKEKIRKQKQAARSEKQDAALRARLANRVAHLAGMFAPAPAAAKSTPKHDPQVANAAKARQQCAKTEAALTREIAASAYWTTPAAVRKAQARVEQARQHHADALAKLAAFGGAPYVPGTPHVKGKQPKIVATGETRSAWIARRAEERYQEAIKERTDAS